MQETNEQDSIKASLSNNSDKKHLSLLKKIFHVSPLNKDIFLPIILSTDDIPKLFFYLNKTNSLKEGNKDNKEKEKDNEDLTLQNKIEILTILMSLFKSSKSLISLFINKSFLFFI